MIFSRCLLLFKTNEFANKSEVDFSQNSVKR